MTGKDVKLIEYPKSVDAWNCITHAAGAVLGVVSLIMMLIKAEAMRHSFCAAVYGLSIIAVFTVSAVYHGLPSGEAKRRARLADHSTVPFLIAGTATPCALISLYEISHAHGLIIFIMGWICAVFGLISKVFFFEKLKSVTMAVYIISGTVMLFSAVPVLDKIDSGAFGELVFGSVLYVIGAVFCGLGVKKPSMHIVFHLFVLLASAVHVYVIYTAVI